MAVRPLYLRYISNLDNNLTPNLRQEKFVRQFPVFSVRRTPTGGGLIRIDVLELIPKTVDNSRKTVDKTRELGKTNPVWDSCPL